MADLSSGARALQGAGAGSIHFERTQSIAEMETKKLSFDVNMLHQFPRVADQVKHGLYALKRAAYFLKKVVSSTQELVVSITKVRFCVLLFVLLFVLILLLYNRTHNMRIQRT